MLFRGECMKQKRILFLCFFVLLILASCNQGFVRKVRVKAAPKLKLNLGSKELNVADILYDKVSNSVKNNSDLRVYKYTPKDNADDTLHFLFHYAMGKKTIDMTDYVNNLNSIPTEKTISINNVAVNIPSIEITKTTGTLRTIQNTTGNDMDLNNDIDILPNIFVNVSVSNLVYADIKEGILKINLDGLDDNIKPKLTINYEQVQIKQGTQVLGNFKNKNNQTGEFDLKNKRITNGMPITVLGSINISGKIPASYTQQINVALKVTSDIKSFNKIKINNQNIQTEIAENISIDPSVIDSVKKLTLNPFLISANIKNKLPNGTDIKIKLESTALNIQTEFTKFDAKPNDNAGEEKTLFDGAITFTPSTNLDVKALFAIAGYDYATKTLTLSNVIAGAEYSFGGSASVKFDLDKAVIQPPSGVNLNVQYSYTIDTDIFCYENINKLKPKPVNAYIYIVSDLLGEDAPRLTTKIDLKYGSTTETIISKDNAQTPFVPEPDFSDFNNKDIPKASIQQDSIDLKNAFESKPDQLEFKTDINVNEITITKNVIKKIKETNNAEFNAHLITDVPLSVKVKDDIVEGISIEDILARKSGETTLDKFNLAIDAIKELSLVIEYKNNTGIMFDARVYNPDWIEGGNFKFEKKVKLSDNGKIRLSLSKEEIQHIREQNPFPIKLEVMLPKDADISLKNGSLKLSAYTVADMNIVYEF